MRVKWKAYTAALAVVAILGPVRGYAQASGNGSPAPPPQSHQPPPTNRPSSSQSVVVKVQETPEEAEDGKLNDAYQSVREQKEQQGCAGAIEKYRSLVIPLAEQAKFNVPRNKFLYLSYQGIAGCDLSLGSYAEAEELFQKILEYVPVWPGISDSDYPIDFRSIGVARMGQQNWKGAEESLQKSITLFDQQIDRAVHSDSEIMRTEHANNLRMSEDIALNLLAVDYFREQRPGDALPLLDRAYDQAVAYHASPEILKQIVDTGVSISTAVGDSDDKATWAERAAAPH